MTVGIRAACSPGEIRAAAVQGGVLIDLAIERPGASYGVGDRMRGRVLSHVPGMAGAFVALPGGGEGFLPDSQAGAKPVAGAAVTVSVTRAGQGGKGPRLAASTHQAEPGPPTLLARGPGAIARLLALHPGATVMVDDPAAAPPGAAVAAHAWDSDLADQVAALGAHDATLPGGVVAHIHPTPALVAIDLDAAPDDRRPKAGAQRDANRAALPGLAREIRLRNLSGAIVVDLAGMAMRARAALAPDFVSAFAADPMRPRFLGFTALGLAEILRPRAHPPLHELLAGPHAAALAALRALAADPIPSQALRAAPDVARALDDDAPARADLARRTGRPLLIRIDPALPPGAWTLEPVPRG